MINYSSFSIEQLQAVDEVLDYITDRLDSDLAAAIVYREYRFAHQAVTAAIDQQARDHAAAEAEKVNRIKEACIAGAPPAEAQPATDPPAPPDMFGWVGDALDDLCAAGEVMGK